MQYRISINQSVDARSRCSVLGARCSVFGEQKQNSATEHVRFECLLHLLRCIRQFSDFFSELFTTSYRIISQFSHSDSRKCHSVSRSEQVGGWMVMQRAVQRAVQCAVLCAVLWCILFIFFFGELFPPRLLRQFPADHPTPIHHQSVISSHPPPAASNPNPRLIHHAYATRTV